MALKLTDAQQLDLLNIYLQSNIALYVAMAAGQNLGYSPEGVKQYEMYSYNIVISRLQEAHLPFIIQKKTISPSSRVIDHINEQLRDFIYQSLPGSKLYSHFYSLYDQLDEQYCFDSSETPDLKKNMRATVSAAISDLIRHYHNQDLKHAKSNAFWDSAAFCLLIVTIPFVKLFYNYRIEHYKKDHAFAELSVSSNHLLDEKNSIAAHALSENTTNKVKDILKMKSQELGYTPHGLTDKTFYCAASPFKDVLFSSAQNIRKCLSGHHFDGIRLLGTKKQIQDSAAKFDAYLQKQRRGPR